MLSSETAMVSPKHLQPREEIWLTNGSSGHRAAVPLTQALGLKRSFIMNDQLFNSFDRTEYSDEIFSIIGRALTTATRFDSTCKTLARIPLYKISLFTKHELSSNEYDQIIKKISNNYKNLNRAIKSLKLNENIETVLTSARESRNELIHETTLGIGEGFDNMDNVDLSNYLNQVKKLAHQIIKGYVLISYIISMHNKDSAAEYLLSESYENKYLNWVMERF